jgi:hypothetical protein
MNSARTYIRMNECSSAQDRGASVVTSVTVEYLDSSCADTNDAGYDPVTTYNANDFEAGDVKIWEGGYFTRGELPGCCFLWLLHSHGLPAQCRAPPPRVCERSVLAIVACSDDDRRLE